MAFEINTAMNFMGSIVDGAQRAQKSFEGLAQVAGRTAETVQTISNASQSLSQVISSFKDTSQMVQTLKGSAANLFKVFSADSGQKAASGSGGKAAKTVQKMTKGAKSRATSGKAGGIQDIQKTMGKVGDQTTSFLKDCMDSAEKSQKVQNDLARTIKATGGAAGVTAQEVGKMASQLSSASTFSNLAIESGQNLLLKYNNIGKDVFPKASQAMIDLAQHMGKDPVEASKLLGKALNDPIKGMDELTKADIKFTDEQRKQIEAMQKAGDMAGAQKVMLNALNAEVGGKAAEAANTYTGKLKQITVTLGEIKEKIGQAVLPYIKKAEDLFLGMAQAIKNLPAPVMDIIAKILMFVAVAGTLVGHLAMFKMIGASLAPILSKIAGIFGMLPLPLKIAMAVIALLAAAFATNFCGIRDIVMSVFNKISGAVKSAIDVFKKTGSAAQGIGALFTNLFGPKVGGIVTSTIKLIISTVKSVIDFIRAHMPQIRNIIQNVFKGIQAVWNTVLKPVLLFAIQIIGKLIGFVVSNWPLIRQTIIKVMTIIKNVISTVLNAVMSFWKAHGQTIMSVVGSAFNIIKTIISTVLNVITGVIKAVMQIINGDWSGAWNTIKSTVQSVFNGAVDIVKNVLSAIGNVFKDIAKTALGWGKDMIMGIVDGIKGAVSYIEDAVGGVADTIKSFLHFSVPDKGPLTDYESWMPDFMKGMSHGIKVNTHLVTSPVKDLAFGIKATMNKNISGVSNPKDIKNTGTAGDSSLQNGFAINIAKLADSIVVREESDIDKIATALANKLAQTALGMG